MSHSYGPATILTLSPQSKYLYAYFPPTQSLAPAGGLACVWEAEESLDTWNVKDFWHFPAEAGIVAMRWLGEEREVRTLDEFVTENSNIHRFSGMLKLELHFAHADTLT